MTDHVQQKARLCVLISGSGSNLQAIMDACHGHTLHAEVVQVISNRADAYGLIRAQQAQIPTEVLNHKTFADRPGFDAALADLIDRCQPDFIVLAGFMRILTPSFVERFLGKLINIHPSLLPKYPGLDTHARALAAGDREHGATVHFVTPTVDAGPPIVQGILNVLPDDSVDSLKARIHQLEHVIYPYALDRLIKGQVCYRQQQAQWTDGRADNTPDIIRL
jgi:phosphoribosylglycinamide formyltransferase-1